MQITALLVRHDFFVHIGSVILLNLYCKMMSLLGGLPAVTNYRALGLLAILLMSAGASGQVCDDKDARRDNYIGKHNYLADSDRRWYSIIPLEQDQEFYQTQAAFAVGRNIIMLQMPSGGWRKNVSPE